MATSTENKVLIQVTLDASDAIKKTVELQQTVIALKQQQKELDTSTTEGATAYEQLNVQIKATNNEIRAYQKETQNAITQTTAEEGSLTQLKASLSSMTVEYNNMSAAKRNSAEGKSLQKSIVETSDALKTGEQAISNYRKSVGDYRNAIIRTLSGGNSFVANLMNMAKESKSMGEFFKVLASNAKAFGLQLLELCANPFIAVAAIIVGLILLLVSAFKQSEEQVDKMSIVTAKLGAIFSTLMDSLQPIAGFLVDVLIQAFGKLGEMVEWTVKKMIDVLHFIGQEDWANALERQNEATKKNIELATIQAQKQIELTNLKRADKVEQASLNAQENKYKDILSDQLKPIRERMAAASQLREIMKKQHDLNMKEATLELQILESTNEATKQSTQYKDALAEAQAKILQIDTDYQGKQKELTKQTSSAQIQAAQQAYDLKLKEITDRQALEKSAFETSNELLSDDFATKQRYAAKALKLQQDQAKEILDFNLKSHKINQKTYDDSLTEQANATSKFYQDQYKAAEQYQKGLRTSILSLFSPIDAQIQDVNEKYKKAFADLNSEAANKMPSLADFGGDQKAFDKAMNDYKAFMLSKYQIEIGLEKQQAAEIRNIQQASLQQQIKDIEDIIKLEYKGDLAKYTDNEREKTKITIEELKKKVEAKKKAGLDTGADEAALRASENQLAQIQMNTELLQANLTAKQKYDIKKEYLDKEAALYQGNADKEAQIDAAKGQNEKDLRLAQIESFKEWSTYTEQRLQGISDFASQLEAQQLQDYQDKHDAQTEILDRQLKSGIISQQEHNIQVKKLDAQLAKEKAKIAHDEAIREKALKAFSIITSTATAIMKTGATLGYPLAIPFQIAAGIAGAIQLATVMATPVPKAARGAYINGNSHSLGGVQIEAEGGEIIINKRSSSMFMPLLSAINEAGGGIPFSTPMSDGGFSARVATSNNAVSAADIADAVVRGVQQTPIVATIEDINRANKEYISINANGNS